MSWGGWNFYCFIVKLSEVEKNLKKKEKIFWSEQENL
jgi:hypothetical protein